MKSKVKAFFLSFIPGLGHIYLGQSNRGLIFLGGFFTFVFSASYIGHSQSLIGGGYGRLLEGAIPLVWILCLVDCLINTDRVNKGTISLDEEENRNVKLIAYLLSIVPGLGHIYYGRKEKGQKLLYIFLIVYILAAIMSFDLIRFGVLAVIIYSVLDLMNIKVVSEYSEIDFQGKNFDNWVKVLGVVMIGAGVVTLCNKFLGEFFDGRMAYLIRDYAKVIVSSGILIGFGIKILSIAKPKSISEEE